MLESDTLYDAVATPRAPAASRPVYDVEIVRDPEAALGRLAAAFDTGTATPFQAPGWLSAWYATVGAAREAEPLIVFVTERETGQSVVTLPLIRRREGGRDVITFADLGVTDYNAPILGPASPATPQAARGLWASIVKALPAVDLFVFRKMPADGARPTESACAPAGRSPLAQPGLLHPHAGRLGRLSSLPEQEVPQGARPVLAAVREGRRRGSTPDRER